jgi:hypothetical protein
MGHREETYEAPVFFYAEHTSVPGAIGTSSHTFIFWPLCNTPRIKHGDEIWSALCNEDTDCVVLNTRYALVVWRETRLGVIALESAKTELRSWDWSLRNHVRGEVRSIIIR